MALAELRLCVALTLSKIIASFVVVPLVHGHGAQHFISIVQAQRKVLSTLLCFGPLSRVIVRVVYLDHVRSHTCMDASRRRATNDGSGWSDTV